MLGWLLVDSRVSSATKPLWSWWLAMTQESCQQCRAHPSPISSVTAQDDSPQCGLWGAITADFTKRKADDDQRPTKDPHQPSSHPTTNFVTAAMVSNCSSISLDPVVEDTSNRTIRDLAEY